MSEERALLAVTLLAESEEARRLVVSWRLVPRDASGTDLLLTWARVSAVRYHEVERWAPVLEAHGICRADRTVDPDAMRAVKHLAAQQVAARKERRR